MHLLLFGIPYLLDVVLMQERKVVEQRWSNNAEFSYLLDVVQMQENKGGRIKVEQQC